MNGPAGEVSPDMHIHLRSWRKSRGLTLAALADAIGSKTSTLAGWETGKRQVDLKDLAELAGFYGVHPAALLFEPQGADDKVRRMQRASTLAERMPDAAANEWLSLGERLIHDKKI